ncbi:hypothetical protein [Janthinobacterium sp.]|uniref:hypothetical protein n=1 Tax=Janthinobacterium sp. TaxID=1871054 RepID=UPI00261ECE17|nr:hypothetical protein [Janthinobacterium sp.]
MTRYPSKHRDSTASRRAASRREMLLPPGRAKANDHDDETTVFTEEELVALHWLLLSKVSLLSEESTPLDEKFELVRWVFTDPVRDAQPFSFVNCMKVVSGSPLSPLPFIGALDAEEVRDWIAAHLHRWFIRALSAYPPWVQCAVQAKPDWIADNLSRNPQWMNEQIRIHDTDLFTAQNDLGASDNGDFHGGIHRCVVPGEGEAPCVM